MNMCIVAIVVIIRIIVIIIMMIIMTIIISMFALDGELRGVRHGVAELHAPLLLRPSNAETDPRHGAPATAHFQATMATFQIEGLKSQSHCLVSLLLLVPALEDDLELPVRDGGRRPPLRHDDLGVRDLGGFSRLRHEGPISKMWLDSCVFGDTCFVYPLTMDP